MGAVGVNPIETYIRRGYFAEDVPLPGPELPYIPGTDAAGVVEEVGPQVTKFKVPLIEYNKLQIFIVCLFENLTTGKTNIFKINRRPEGKKEWVKMKFKGE